MSERTVSCAWGRGEEGCLAGLGLCRLAGDGGIWGNRACGMQQAHYAVVSTMLPWPCSHAASCCFVSVNKLVLMPAALCDVCLRTVCGVCTACAAGCEPPSEFREYRISVKRVKQEVLPVGQTPLRPSSPGVTCPLEFKKTSVFA
jgi:hypothetical protein